MGRKTIHKGFGLPHNVLSSYQKFIVDHDESWLFTLAYVGLAVFLSLYISMFWLVAIAATHGAIEWVSLRLKGQSHNLFGKVVWHLRLDIVLIIFALWLSVYIDAIFGLLGLGAAARGGAQAGSRLLAWQRTLRGTLLTLDDVVQILRALLRNRNVAGGNGSRPEELRKVESNAETNSKWAKGDVFLVVTGFVLAISIATAPVLTEMDAGEVLSRVASDLQPWP